MCILTTAAAAAAGTERAGVRVMRVPGGGIQPQVAVDGEGGVHLIYYKGDPRNGDIFYVRSGDGGETFSKPIRVNGRPGSALAIGSVRGPHLALGKGGRPHVAWMGSGIAEPKGPGGKGTPMLYARLNEDGSSFEEQRNVIAAKAGLDGGGTVAADGRGRVYVAWHAPTKPKGDEADRRIWVAVSEDEGRTFAPEVAVGGADVGACACCSMRLLATGEGVLTVFRCAREQVNRDLVAVVGRPGAAAARAVVLDPWETGVCPMSTMALLPAGEEVLAAWETGGQVRLARLDPATGRPRGPIVSPPGKAEGRKHPAIALGPAGHVLLAWTEGTGWEKGGAVAWQLFDAAGKPVEGAAGRRDGVPAWSLVAAFPDGKGGVVVMY